MVNFNSETLSNLIIDMIGIPPPGFEWLPYFISALIVLICFAFVFGLFRECLFFGNK